MKDIVDDYLVEERPRLVPSRQDMARQVGLGVWLVPMIFAGGGFWVTLAVVLLR